jgi:hypothetical protein
MQGSYNQTQESDDGLCTHLSSCSSAWQGEREGDFTDP